MKIPRQVYVPDLLVDIFEDHRSLLEPPSCAHDLQQNQRRVEPYSLLLNPEP